ncbi:MAG TPA: patatin-like phospholipase family protein [Cyclobacteriaceae bacterium]|nr:patatin-like phospholipase family protein [Cyclobacteriaceae bacterium]
MSLSTIMKRFLFSYIFCFSLFLAQAQKVALVLSGGAAKGLAHVGVLKALEENDIPIDYIVGTSMGGIIGGCYSAGLSPDQIEDIVTSEGFLRWINGQSEKGYNYFYHLSDDNPNFLKLNLGLDSTYNLQLSTMLASDVSLNFVLAEKMAQAAAISRNNFDSLFVPLRVLAADIFTQSQVVLSRGFLNDALRATQTVPFFYTPIRVDGKYLFDGGIYNNFPIDVAIRDFNPDVVIGSNVSSKIYDKYPFDNDEKLINNSLLLMLIDNSNPADIPVNGVYIQPNVTGYTAFDFAKVRGLIDSGYVQTIRQIAEIKSKVNKKITCEQVMSRRNDFTNKSYPMIFDGVAFRKYNSKQRKYISRVFHINPLKPKPMYFDQIKRDYFRLVSEDYFKNAYPNILFDENKKTFKLQLTRRPQKNFQVDFGGVIASRDISNIFLGLNYFNFGSKLVHVYTGFQTGNFYRSAVIKTRIDFPYRFYVEPEIVFNGYNYLSSNDLLQVITPTVLKRLDRRVGITLGVPIGSKYKSSVTFEGLNNVDRYDNHDVFVTTDTLDQLRLKGYKLSFNLSTSDLNRKQYASEGKAFTLNASYFNLNEQLSPGNTSDLDQVAKANYQWARLKISAEQYFKVGWFHPGYYLEGVISNQTFFQNYLGTIINAPAFLPLQDSRTLLLQNFRSFNYLAGGMRNVFTLYKKLDLRLEGYVFKPLEYIEQGELQRATKSVALNHIFVASTIGFVYHSPIGPVSLSANYYDDKENQFGILLHAGFLLFNKHALDQ